MNTLLKGHRALVTGASSGIGKEYAKQLAALGCDLVIAARRIDRLEILATELRKKHSIQVDCIQVDFLQAKAAEELFEKATANSKNISILINNAGIGKYGFFMNLSLKEHLQTLQINTKVTTELTYRFAEHMLEGGKKSYIVQVASIAAFQPVANFSVYSATKAYLRYFSETLRFELKDTAVHVMCLCPGGTYTEFFAQSGQKITPSGHLTMMSAEAVVRTAIHSMLKKKAVCVPGFLNQLACFLPRFLPRNLGLFLAFKTMSRAVEKLKI